MQEDAAAFDQGTVVTVNRSHIVMRLPLDNLHVKEMEDLPRGCVTRNVTQRMD